MDRQQKGNENLALILGLVSVPLSLILFGVVTAIGSIALILKGRRDGFPWTGKLVGAATAAILGLGLSLIMANGYRDVYLRWYGIQEDLSTHIGEQIESYTLRDIDGTNLVWDPTRPSQEKGFMLVHVFATWCGPCERELPQLKKIAFNYKEHISVIGISQEDEATLRSFRDKEHINHPLFSVPLADLPAPINTAKAYPTSFLIDNKGKVIEAKSGAISEKVIKKWLEKHKDALEELAPEQL